MKTRIAALAASAALAGSGALAQVVDAWDDNDDGLLDEAEFSQGLLDAGVFDEWDVDDDDLVGSDEFAEGVYGLWDTDGDGELTIDEWDNAVDRWFSEDAVNLSVEAWDENGNGAISLAEFAAGLAATDLFARFDVGAEEGVLAEDELASGLFDVADLDDDDAVDVDEDSWLTDVGEFLAPDGPVDVQQDAADDDAEMRIIERGEAFTQLPVPCGGESGSCQEIAQRFCSTLGYGAPIDFLDVDGQLYAIRCQDEL